MSTLLEQKYKGDPRTLSPVVLAFLGDGVFELMVREKLLESGTMPANKLHTLCVKKVNARAQAAAYGALLEVLTPSEADILKRGRNANTTKVPKSASVEQYRKATAIEALFGFLYLCGETGRIGELFEIIYGFDENAGLTPECD